MTRGLAQSIVLGLLALVAPQSTTPSFEVATIKPHKNTDRDGGGLGGGCRGRNSRPSAIPLGRCVFEGMNLKLLISAAYRLTEMSSSLDHLIIGGPSWMSTEPFNLEAKAEDPEHTTREQLEVMLQNLLVERFNLKFHREKREVQGFDLLVAKTGLKLNEVNPTETRSDTLSFSLRIGARGGANFDAPASPIGALVNFLSGRLRQPVQNKTSLTGRYNIKLNWQPGDNETGFGRMNRPVGVAPEPGPSLVTALQEQLGLRLESTKVTVDAIVIDSAERPTGQ